DVDGAHEDRVDGPGEEARDQADEHPGTDTDEHGDEAGRQCLGRTVDGAGKDVAAELVGAEEVVGARWQQPLGGIAGERIETGEQSGPQGRGSGEGEDGDGPDGAEPRRGRGEAAKDPGDSIAVRSRAGFDPGPDRAGRTLGVL